MLIHLVLFLFLLLFLFFSLPSSCVSVYVALVHKTSFFFMIIPQCIHWPTGEHLGFPKFMVLKFLIMNSITYHFVSIRKISSWPNIYREEWNCWDKLLHHIFAYIWLLNIVNLLFKVFMPIHIANSSGDFCCLMF